MKKILILISIFIVSVAFSYYIMNNTMSKNTDNIAIERVVENLEKNIDIDDNDLYRSIYLAWGCFWCIEWAFENEHGVMSAVSGYAWWTKSTANYKQISTGETAHRETVKVTYDPMKITFENILDTYFWYIDPYDIWGQFTDRWYQYTTAIFYKNDIEKNKILEYINNHDFEDNLATKFVKIESFYEAEEEHQNFAQKKSWNYDRYFQGSGRKDYVEENKDKYK